MGDAADDTRDEEEYWDELKWLHAIDRCEGPPPGFCPFCDPNFKPLFQHQHRPRKERKQE